jgi:hypothetical protein
MKPYLNGVNIEVESRYRMKQLSGRCFRCLKFRNERNSMPLKSDPLRNHNNA